MIHFQIFASFNVQLRKAPKRIFSYNINNPHLNRAYTKVSAQLASSLKRLRNIKFP
jgi:hypothetical protein